MATPLKDGVSFVRSHASHHNAKGAHRHQVMSFRPRDVPYVGVGESFNDAYRQKQLQSPVFIVWQQCAVALCIPVLFLLFRVFFRKRAAHQMECSSSGIPNATILTIWGRPDRPSRKTRNGSLVCRAVAEEARIDMDELEDDVLHDEEGILENSLPVEDEVSAPEKKPAGQQFKKQPSGKEKAKPAKSYTTPAVVRAREQFVRSVLSRGVTYDDNLPICQAREEIADAIRSHQVVVICGETGSGKTTQLPKICLELGRGQAGLIGHTQPRRLAARAVASRIAEELRTKVGEGIGFQVRFTDESSDSTCCKLMTDGILLAEVPNDRLLTNYDTIIVDEAHERSLNIDFLLGYLKEILPRRPDLKVIIMSATIDSERFAEHFNNAPVLTVEGRTYPVEVIYQPGKRESEDPISIRMAVETLIRREKETGAEPGDVLVFLPGEREIQEATIYLKRFFRGFEILPLFARLSRSDQDRIFSPTGEQRRIVLATNVAETSLTVPGISYVVDTGSARISRYSLRSRVQGLRVEAISQASANQRKGRCGRLRPGICVRTYSEEDFLERLAFTDPEILRTNLASVILQMLWMGLGGVAEFPFIDMPKRRAINDGMELLKQLGALDGSKQLTPLGVQLARLPLDPQLGAMLVAASKEGSLREMLVVVSAIAAQDPRNRPADKREAAEAALAQFNHPKSDFMTYLNIWQAYQEEKSAGNSLWKWCDACFLSFTRMKEWQDLHGQLLDACQRLHLRLNSTPATYSSLHRALLVGLPDMVGVKDERNEQYAGCNGKKFRIHPSSPMQKKGFKWVLAGELIETTQVYASNVAKLEPQWVESILPHLVRLSYAKPYWDSEANRVSVYKEVTLLGLEVMKKKISHHTVNRAEAREIFLHDALATDEYDSEAAFLAHNRAVLAEVQAYETKLRRRSSVNASMLFDFYNGVVPQTVATPYEFEKWYADEAPSESILFLPDSILSDLRSKAPPDLYPDLWTLDGHRLPLTYRYLPGSNTDGVTLTVPVLALGSLKAEALEWLVPGLLPAKLEVMIRGLPNLLRGSWPPDTNQRVMKAVTGGEFGRGCLRTALTRAIEQAVGRAFLQTPQDLWQAVKVPPHHMMRIEAVDVNQRVVAEGRDLGVLQRQCANAAYEELAPPFVRKGLTTWSFGTWPKPELCDVAGISVLAHPALVDCGTYVNLTAYADSTYAEQVTRMGLVRLALLSRPRVNAEVERQLKANAGTGLAALKTAGAPTSSSSSSASSAKKASAEAPRPAGQIVASVSSTADKDKARTGSPFQALQALRAKLVQQTYIPASVPKPQPTPRLQPSPLAPVSPRPTPAAVKPPKAAAKPTAPPAPLKINAAELAARMMAPKDPTYVPLPAASPSARAAAPSTPPPPPPPKPSAAQIIAQIRAPKVGSVKSDTFSPREAFTTDEAWIRHVYSRMGKVPAAADLENPLPSNLSKDDLELLLELKEASQYFPEARDILQPGINRSGYVEEILNNRGPAAKQAVRALTQRSEDDDDSDDGERPQPKRPAKPPKESPKKAPKVQEVPRPFATPTTVAGALSWRLFHDAVADVLKDKPTPQTAKDFETLVNTVGPKALEMAPRLAASLSETMRLRDLVEGRMAELGASDVAFKDIDFQIKNLFPPNWIQETPTRWLVELPRFLRGIEIRLQNLDRPRDPVNQKEVVKYWLKYVEVRKELGDTPKVVELRWLLEEFRVSLFAQALRTSVPISSQRLDKYLFHIRT